MVRFKVIKGSSLLFGAAVVVFLLVVCLLTLRYFLSQPAQPTGGAQSSFVSSEGMEAEAAAVSALAAGSESQSSVGLLPLAPRARQGDSLAIEIVPEAPAATAETPRVLIYHTHTHEAYRQVAEDPYAAVEAWRTTDNSHNVVRVGDELTRLLQARGFTVVHDTTDHELTALSTAYERSLDTLQSYDEPFDLYIDLHRDACAEGAAPDVLSAGGRDYARLMVLIGRGDGFSEKPFFQENLAFAKVLTDELNALQKGICKDVLVKKNRYNQHIGTPAILVEVGSNQNTLDEALASMPVLAEGIDAVLRSLDPGETQQYAAEGS